MKRYMEHFEYCSGLLVHGEGDWVKFDEAQAEIDSRDKRLVDLESAAQSDAIQIGLLEGYRQQLRKEVVERNQDIAAANARIIELEDALRRAVWINEGRP